MINVKIAGKINLSLKVLGMKGNFHELDMATSSVDIFDEVAISPSKYFSCNIIENVKMEKNTGYIAAKLFSETFHTPCVDIKIKKNIPFMAGLGGSSADAAGVIFGMMKLFAIDDLDACIEVARKIGSDVPLMLIGGLIHVSGTGEIVKKIKSDLKFNVLTAMNCDGNSSKDVYAEFDKHSFRNKIDCENIITHLENNDYVKSVDCVSNDLQDSALNINPKIQSTLDFLKDAGARKTIVYGSGSACGGIFDDFQCAKEVERKFKSRFKFLKALQTIENGIFIDEEK